jgi:hypothetical protein
MAIQKNFVIKNGLEVDTNLIVADAQTNRVGIGTTVPQYTLHVNGGIGATDLRVTGVGTFTTLNANNAYLDNAFISSGVGTFTTLNVDDINIDNAYIDNAFISSGVGTFTTLNANNAYIDNAFISSGVITSFVSTSGTITSLSGTNLNYSGISTLGILTSNQITSQNLNVTGISTFNNIVLDGYVSIGGTIGFEGQVLVSTGVGVTWRTRNDIRNTTTFTATNGQTSFAVNYSIGYVDVYINGVKLTSTEFTATSGTVVVLDDVCFGDEIVEFITYELDYPLTFSGLTIQDENSTVGTGISAINFVGSGVTASVVGSSATVYVSGYYANVAGIATYADTSGIATYANVAGIATYADTSGIATYATNAGIATYATNAGIATYATNAGIATYATNAGIATVAQNLTGSPNIEVGIITATGGFVSIAGTTPITIELIGNQLTFNAVGIGSSTLTLF